MLDIYKPPEIIHIEARFADFKRENTFCDIGEARAAMEQFMAELKKDGERRYGHAFQQHLLTRCADCLSRAKGHPFPIELKGTSTIEWQITPVGVGLAILDYDLSSIEERDLEDVPEWLFPADYDVRFIAISEDDKWLTETQLCRLLSMVPAKLHDVLAQTPRYAYQGSLSVIRSVRLSYGAALYIAGCVEQGDLAWPHFVATPSLILLG